MAMTPRELDALADARVSIAQLFEFVSDNPSLIDEYYGTPATEEVA